MKLLELSYRDEEADWGFDKLTFYPDVTLLVGASGVGKTRILKAIRHLRQIASDGQSRADWGINWCAANWGVNWSARFLDQEGHEYLWTGGFTKRDPSLYSDDNDEDDPFVELDDQIEKKKPRLAFESLLLDRKPVFERKDSQVTLHGKELEAKLSAHESGISLLSEEDAIKPAKAALSRMLFVDATEEMSDEGRVIHYFHGLKRVFQRHTDLESIRNATLSTRIKLALVYRYEKDTFDEIVAQFKDVFPYVAEVVVEQAEASVFAGNVPVIKLKEKGSSRYFTQDSLSSGMRRTLMHLARLTLWPDGTLWLIDEFENSLGANCINVVADGLLSGSKRLQFIITSHHPYIINKIPMERWKVIARDGGRVEYFSTEQLGIGKSKHTAFTLLNNSPVFKYGTLPNEPVLSGRGELNRVPTVSGMAEPSEVRP